MLIFNFSFVDILKNSILPLLLKLIDVCSNADDDTKIILAKEIGILSLCLSNCASAKELSFIINIYQKLSMAGLSVCIQHF